ncbi:MAG: ATP-binding cassette domain-containing protein [Treponema sp.]|jgi:peptide/nickel transport system ATP-binding protein|nr:ATP-binding cassette domain-containing protein [Treponema sp.]
MPNLVEIQNLKKYFETHRGSLHAVDDITMSLKQGETMGVVGESGCGKSTLGRTLIRLIDSDEGSIKFDGAEITGLKDRKSLRELREKAQIIFQDPYSSLNPRMTVEQTLKEPLILSKRFNRTEINEQVENLMQMVGIDERIRLAFPHELDGGRRQRVGIGRALALNPKFVVCDEPVSALDVSIQAQILNLLMDLQDKYGLTYMFITHNMAVVRHISTNISVMYLGQLVETSPTKNLFKNPLHPYTRALLSAIPTVKSRKNKKRIVLQGELTSPINPRPGCRFAKRCLYAQKSCREPQRLRELEAGHFVSCCRCEEIAGTGAEK